MKIMIDPGHYGYSNRSPVVPEYYESKRMWVLSHYLAEELSVYGFEVFMTRDDENIDVPVVARGEKAKGCDLFLSMHSNAVGDGGSEKIDAVHVYAAYDNLNNSHELAKIIGDAVAECMGVSGASVKTRKSEKGDWEYYGVLRGARNVGCPLYYIIEHSFHTNKYATNWLLSDDNLRRLARIEAAVIASYYGLTLDYDLGDVNMNGKLDATDYILVKRAVLGTLDLSALQARLADMNQDGKLDTFDYILLKRKILNN